MLWPRSMTRLSAPSPAIRRRGCMVGEGSIRRLCDTIVDALFDALFDCGGGTRSPPAAAATPNQPEDACKTSEHVERCSAAKMPCRVSRCHLLQHNGHGQHG